MSCRIWRSSGISGCSWLAVLLLLCVSGTCSAQSSVWNYQVGSEYYYSMTPTQIAGIVAASDAASLAGGCSTASGGFCYRNTYENLSCTPNTAPTANGQTSACSWQVAVYCPSWAPNCTLPSPANEGINVTSRLNGLASQVATCGGLAGADSEVDGLSSTSGYAVDSQGCVTQINMAGGWGVCTGLGENPSSWTCDVQETGAYEYPPPSATGPTSNCVIGGGTTACAQTSGSGAGQCGTFNGDQVCPTALQPGQCVSYASGGSACVTSNNAGGVGGTVPASAPTAPGGGAATPTGVVTSGQPSVSTSTAYYYSSSTTQSSPSAVAASSGGQNVGNGGQSSSGSGSSSGSCGSGTTPCSVSDANAAANGDCSAGGCSGTGTGLPGYDWSSDSWSGATTSFWNAVASGPIGSAVGGISSNWPSGGSCPAETVYISTVNYTADYGTPLCNVWENDAVPIFSAVMLAVWSIVAVLIFLSA